MYGEQRHISVLRAEIESNDVEYLSEWKFREDVRRRYSTSTVHATTPPPEHITSPYFRPASTTANPQKATASKTQLLKSGQTQKPKPMTPHPNNYNNTTSTQTTGTTPNSTTTKVTTTSTPTTLTTTEETTMNFSINSSTDIAAEKTLNTLTDATQNLDTSTTPCTSTEQTEASTADPPTATTMELTSEESTTATIQTEKIKEEVVAPFWANNTRGEVLALLNLYPFEQYVHWEKCTYEHKQMFCREGCRCEQQYRLHRLLAYDPNNECRGIFSDWFKFPSCCVCRCYDLPVEFQITSRSPRLQSPIWNLYNNAPPDWYRLANAG
ncbi:hypothetical protein C0J52_01655 [Blattella germanica]|nr:hypothetical protein C0J52_01655 [Blattella germanica]